MSIFSGKSIFKERMTLQKLKKIIFHIFIVFLLLFFSICIYYLYFINQNITVKILGTGVLLVFVMILFFLKKRQPTQEVYKQKESVIRKYVLITRDGETEKEWSCKGVNSFLIGKGTVSHSVDIDLSDTYYAQYVSNEHAVLNFFDGYWYIEDLNSANGVGLKKRGEEYSLRLKPLTSYKVDGGDIIYISKVKILAN